MIQMTENKFTCASCGHHIYDHKYKDPIKLTSKQRRTGIIPWYCDIDACKCIEFVPGR